MSLDFEKPPMKWESWGATFSDNFKKYEPRISYTAKLSFNYQGYRKEVLNMQKLKEYHKDVPFLQNALEDGLHPTKRWLENFRKRTDNEHFMYLIVELRLKGHDEKNRL